MAFWNTENIKPVTSNRNDRYMPTIDLKFSYGIVHNVILNDDGSIDYILVYLPERAKQIKATPISKYDVITPLISEAIWCLQRREEEWFYIDVINNNTNYIANSKDRNTNVLNTSNNRYLGTNFTNNNISVLKVFEGDRIISGRFGNSIRFGSNNINNDNSWSLDGRDGSPITIITNGRPDNSNLESIDTDTTSIYLTSDQSLPINAKTYKEYDKLDNYIGAQAVVTSDRLVFYSKNEHIILAAKEEIGLSTKKWNIDLSTFVDLMLDTIKSIKDLSTQLSNQSTASGQITVTSSPTGGVTTPPVNASQFVSIKSQTAQINSKLSNIETQLENMKQ